MVSLVDKCFSDADFNAIETAVKKAEMSTGGEIAIELASRSKHWQKERLIHSLVLTLAIMLAALYLTREDDWGTYYSTTQTIMWGAIGFAACYWGWGHFLKRRDRRRRIVWSRAVSQFHQLTPVRGLTGVLILVSLEEEEAAIVADKGIASKVPADYWLAPYETLVAAIKSGKHAEGIIQAVETIAVELARHFPREGDDVNELSDRPRRVD